MGGGSWDHKNWKDYTDTRSYSTKSVDAIYDRRTIDPDLDPKGVKVRESRDSVDNPRSTPLIVGLDVTGSMTMVLEDMARKGLNTLVSEVYNRQPITNPHILCAGIGDAHYDRAPLQITQFEADIRIAQQLEKIWLEKGGGANDSEGYALVWYLAANLTDIDSFKLRGQKGYLFTIGDEEPTDALRVDEIERIFGHTLQADVDLPALLTLASRQWEIFHIMVAEGSYAGSRPGSVRDAWTKILGQNAIWLQDHTKLAEVIVSIMQIREGTDHAAVVGSWDGSTALVVKNATSALSKRDTAGGEVVTL